MNTHKNIKNLTLGMIEDITEVFEEENSKRLQPLEELCKIQNFKYDDINRVVIIFPDEYKNKIPFQPYMIFSPFADNIILTEIKQIDFGLGFEHK